MQQPMATQQLLDKVLVQVLVRQEMELLQEQAQEQVLVQLREVIHLLVEPVMALVQVVLAMEPLQVQAQAMDRVVLKEEVLVVQVPVQVLPREIQLEMQQPQQQTHAHLTHSRWFFNYQDSALINAGAHAHALNLRQEEIHQLQEMPHK